MIRKRFFNIFYFTISILSIVALRIFPMAFMVLKPLVICSLLGFYINSLKKQHNYIITALVFAIIGDTFLLFKNDTTFILGLLSFSFTHLLYSLYLRQFRGNDISMVQKFFLVLTTLGSFIYLGHHYTNVQDSIIIITIFVLCLWIMSVNAILFPRLSKKMSYIGIGAVILVLSHLLMLISNDVNGEILLYISYVFYLIGQYLVIGGITNDALDYFNKLETRKLVKNKK